MEKKSIKKSTPTQLQTLVDFMEENPALARGVPGFGSSKVSAERQWKNLVLQLNSLGPPIRSLVEWKKSWADLKSRTKKKISENERSLNEPDGGLYRVNCLSDLEETIDRILQLSKAASPDGTVFGFEDNVAAEETNTIEDCFQSLTEQQDSQQSYQQPHNSTSTTEEQQHSPQQTYILEEEHANQQTHTYKQQQHTTQQKRHREHIEYELPGCSSVRKKAKRSDEQILLIRRQIKVSERATGIAKAQKDAVRMLADAAQQIAFAAEWQAEAAKRMADGIEEQNKILSSFLSVFKNK